MSEIEIDTDFGKYLSQEQRVRAHSVALQRLEKEIDLAWTRAYVFGGAVALTFAGSETFSGDQSYLIASIGTILSFIWFLSTRASKRWQLVWEKKLEILEGGVTGPLYSVKVNVNGDIFGAEYYSPSKLLTSIPIVLSLGWVIYFVREACLRQSVEPVAWLVGSGMVCLAISSLAFSPLKN